MSHDRLMPWAVLALMLGVGVAGYEGLLIPALLFLIWMELRRRG